MATRLGRSLLFALTLTTQATTVRAQGIERPNVIIYVIDALRADALGCYGNPRGTTPRLDAFARTAIRFEHVVAQSSWTLPSIASLLTGVAPATHGATGPARGIDPTIATLPALLAGGGYTTAAFVTNYLGSRTFGLDRGFGEYHFYREHGATRRKVYLRSDALHRRIVHWLDRHPRAPFFLWVHATDPHYPYLPPARHLRGPLRPSITWTEAAAAIDALRPLHNGNEAWGARPAPIDADTNHLLQTLYAGEVHAADQWFGALLDTLAARALLDHTLIIVTADHGEEFMEHQGLGHGQTLHREVVDVPLLIRLPGARDGGTTRTALARHVDVAPTVLDAAGVAAPATLEGVSLLGATAPPVTSAIATLRLGRFASDALITPTWKAIGTGDDGRALRWQVFDTVQDPGEHTDIAATSPARVEDARTRLQTPTTAPSTGTPISPERLQQLRDLGYVTGSGDD